MLLTEAGTHLPEYVEGGLFFAPAMGAQAPASGDAVWEQPPVVDVGEGCYNPLVPQR